MSYKKVVLALGLSVLLAACGIVTSTPEARPATIAPTETATPLPPPTATPIPTDTPTPVFTPTPPATNTPVITTEPPEQSAVATPAEAYVFSAEPYAVVNVARDDVLNMRAGPGVEFSVVGTLPYYAEGVQLADAAVTVDGLPWVPVKYLGAAGWVNRNYLSRQAGYVDERVAARAAEIIFAIKNKDMATLATLVHPKKGVRFSPYTYVDVANDAVFSAAELPTAPENPTAYIWGAFDGSGEPINMTFAEYWQRFVYDANFAQPDVIGFNQTVGRGNTINNITEVYPGAVVVEYHFTGFDPKLEGMDWRSLRLVLEPLDGEWVLVGIVHDEWTI